MEDTPTQNPNTPSNPQEPVVPMEPSPLPETPIGNPVLNKTEGSAVETLNEAPPPAKPRSPFPIFAIFAPILLIIALGASGFFVNRYFFKDPFTVLNTAFNNLKNSNSLSASFISDDKSTNLKIDYHKDLSKNSKVDLAISTKDDSPQEVSGSLIFNAKELFMSVKYNQMAEVEKQIGNFFPSLLFTRTYGLLKPVLYENKWLFVDFGSLATAPKTSPNEYQPPATPKKEELNISEKDLKDIIQFKKYDRVFILDKTIYKRLVFGINKTKLLTVLDKLKDSDVNISVSQINSTIKAIEKMENLDGNLVEILIDTQNNISQITLAFPQIPLEEVSQDISSSGAGTNPYLNQALSIFSSLRKNETKGSSLQKIGVIKITNYNKAPSIERPLDFVSFSEVLKFAQIEILPLVSSLLSGSASTTMPTVNPAMGGVPKSALEYSQMLEKQKNPVPTPPINK